MVKNKPPAGGDAAPAAAPAPAAGGGGDKKAPGKAKEVVPEPEPEVVKTPSQIHREEMEYRAMQRRQRFKRRWPEVTKVKIHTSPWHPPGPPEKPPKVIIELPQLKTRQWVPPYKRRRKHRVPMMRIPLENINQPLTENSKLKKIWRGFSQVDSNKMMIQGSIACNSKKYTYSTAKGAQTGCIAVVARGLLEEKAPAELRKSDVDEIISAGDRFYRQCMVALKCYKGKPSLQLNQLLTSFYLHDTKYTYKLNEIEKGVLAKHPENTQAQPDLMTLMEKRAGTNYMYILTIGDDRHFLIWGHPPDSGTACKTVCYIFDPHMLNEIGQPFRWDLSEGPLCCGAKFGGAGFLRYAGVSSFVLDFLANYGDLNSANRAKPKPPITLTEIEICQKEPLLREPLYSVDFKMLTKHCESEWKSLHVNTLYDKKIKEHQYALASLSAVSLATTRTSSKAKMKEFYQKLPAAPPPPAPPVAPDKAPPEPTKETILSYRGEDFFLYCPKADSHLYGRDDLIPLTKSETILHSPVTIQEEKFTSQFKPIGPGVWIIRGSRHHATMRYNMFKNYTGIACCVAALAICQRLRARGWNEDTVDEGLDAGFNLFRDSMTERRGPRRRLVLGELAEVFKVRNQEYKQTTKGIAVWGKLFSNNPKVFDLCRGLETFFTDYDTGVLQIPGECETAIWNEGGKFYMYHPWPADENGMRVSLQGGGKACILRFASIRTMCEHFLTSCNDLKRRPFSISAVNVFPKGTRPPPVNNWKPVAPNKWIIRGSFHEGDERFPEDNRNKQATPAAIAAIAYAKIFDPNEWTTEDVNEVVTRGDMLYGSTIENLEKLGISLEPPPKEEEEAEGEEDVAAGVSGTLAAADVLPRFKVTDYDFAETEVMDSMYSGTLGNAEPGMLTLKAALQAMFKENTAAVLTARGSSLAVWKHENHYFLFDPHGCDAEGFPSDEPDAAAALLRCTTTKELADMILAALPPGKDDSFNLSPVDVTPAKLLADIGAPEHKLENKAFEWMNRGTAAILMGPRGQNSALGKSFTKSGAPQTDLAGRCLALPAAAAFCATTETVPPQYMHQDHMYNFLDTGAEYYKNFVKKTGRREMTPEDLKDRFEMGENTYTLELGEPTRLPLRLPDVIAEGEGGEEGGGLGEGEELVGEQPPKEIKELLTRIWYDNTRPTTTHIIYNDYYQIGVWMASGGKVVAFDPAPTLTKGLLTPQRVAMGDKLRLQRIKDETVTEGEEEGDEEAGGEGEEQPEPEPEFVPPESCPVLMVFATPGEFIDRLIFRAGLDKKQMIGPAWLYPVKIENELTSTLKEKKQVERKGEGDEPAAAEEEEDQLMEPLADEAIGKYMQKCCRTIASVRGRVAQNENYFMDTPNRDNQDAANAIMGIVVNHIEPYDTWKPELIDAILKYGDRLYTMSLPQAKEPPKLHPNEVVNEFNVTSFSVKTEVTPDVVSGDYKAPNRGSGVLNIRRGMEEFFQNHSCGVICCKGFCAAIWKSANGNAYCYWDPHPTGPRGRTSPGGAAALVVFAVLDQLAETFRSNVDALSRPGSSQFTISEVKVTWELYKTPVQATPLSAVPDEGYEWKVLTAYVQVGSGKTILRGTRPRDLTKYARDAMMQSSASAIVAAAMSDIRKPHLWTRRTVDEIICIGCTLFSDSIGSLGYEFRPGDDLLMPSQIVKRFRLGSNWVRFDLQQAYSGKLEQKSHDKMTLKAAMEKFFLRHTIGILWDAPYASACWKAAGAPQYYMMQPYACGPTGLRTDALDNGAACVQTFTSPKLMAFTYLQSVPAEERRKHDFILFNFTASIKPIPNLHVDPPLVKPGLVPATSKVSMSGQKRRADEQDRKHPPGSATCMDAQRATDLRDAEEKKYKGLRNASGWLVLCDGTQFLSASHSIACKKFPYAARNKQATACCVMACAMTRVEDVCRWCNMTLDQILDSGNLLYQDSYLHYKPKGTKLLAMNQILRKFYTPGNCSCRVNIYRPRQSGSVEFNLYDSVLQFFREEESGVFVSGNGDFAVALFRTPKGFYMFDPMDRDRYGRAVAPPCIGRARSCLSQYPSVKALVTKLSSNIPPVAKKDVPVGSDSGAADESGGKEQLNDLEECCCPGVCPAKTHYELEPAKFQIFGVEVTSLQRLNRRQRVMPTPAN